MNIPALLARYNLKPQHIYLLDLIPLIEVVWSDGENQPHEMEIINTITQRHMTELSKLTEGIKILSTEDVQDFLDQFLNTRPPANLLREIRELAIEWWQQTGQLQKKAEVTIDYCMDIAAACVQTYPYGFNERIIQKEKEMIRELVSALGIENR